MQITVFLVLGQIQDYRCSSPTPSGVTISKRYLQGCISPVPFHHTKDGHGPSKNASYLRAAYTSPHTRSSSSVAGASTPKYDAVLSYTHRRIISSITRLSQRTGVRAGSHRTRLPLNHPTPTQPT